MLTAVYRMSRACDPSLEPSMVRLCQRCHRVFYRQLSNWMVYGLLPMYPDDFFIQRDIPQRMSAPCSPGVCIADRICRSPRPFERGSFCYAALFGDTCSAALDL